MKQGGNSKRERVEMDTMATEDFDVPMKQVGNKSKNPWIEFVKDYSQKIILKAKDAMKEIKRLKLYNPTSINGKGFGDLPDELQEKIGNNMDNNSLDNILFSNKNTNRNIRMRGELQRRSNKVQSDFQNLMIQQNLVDCIRM